MRRHHLVATIVVSSVGADSRSSAFYLKVKGEMEEALRSLGFDRLDIVRPGLLRGDRGPERRFGERVGILISPLVNLVLRGRLDRYAAIDADTVAMADIPVAVAVAVFPEAATYVAQLNDAEGNPLISLDPLTPTS